MCCVKIIVETVMARVSGEELHYVITKSPHPKIGDPLATARAAVASHFPDVWLKQAIVHSTSWRYDDESIVLTFLAYDDDIPLSGFRHTMQLTSVEDRANDDDGEASVAAHALRHLAFLVETEPKEFVPRIRAEALARIRTVAPDISRNRTPEAA